MGDCMPEGRARGKSRPDDPPPKVADGPPADGLPVGAQVVASYLEDRTWDTSRRRDTERLSSCTRRVVTRVPPTLYENGDLRIELGSHGRRRSAVRTSRWG